MPNNTFLRIRYLYRVLRILGPLAFLNKIKNQVYQHTIRVMTEKDFMIPDVPVHCDIKYTLRQATPEDMELILEKARTGDKETAQHLLPRILLYEYGFHHCYIAWDDATGEPCQMQWLITPEDIRLFGHPFSFPPTRLGPNQVMAEYFFTFEKYRRKGLASAVACELKNVALKMGMTRCIGYVERKNIPQLKLTINLGTQIYEEIEETRLLFFRTRKRRKFSGIQAEEDNKPVQVMENTPKL